MILFLCAVGTLWDIVEECVQPSLVPSMSKNEGFMPVQHDSEVLPSGDASTHLINSAPTLRENGSRLSVPVLVYSNQPGLISCVLCIMRNFIKCIIVYLMM